MPKSIKKENLPTKVCAVCHRPFSWRKKWEKVWEDVKYCSERCRLRNLLKKAPGRFNFTILVTIGGTDLFLKVLKEITFPF